ncbi:MAG TPA: hypothetical protein VN776_07110 [Terracidiphilus sp.]|nr:hypothetical protein [Terracidiphilus sp.]
MSDELFPFVFFGGEELIPEMVRPRRILHPEGGLAHPMGYDYGICNDKRTGTSFGHHGGSARKEPSAA